MKSSISIPSEDRKENPQSESENDTKFKKKNLKIVKKTHNLNQKTTPNSRNLLKSDLKGLCSQLHHAADSYQSTFLNSNQKQLVVKNTKEYIHSALVTVVDHLGSVSANLDHHLSKTGSIHQTEVKINFLNQKLLTCQDYAHKLAVAKVSLRDDVMRYNSRYIKPPVSDVLKLNESFRESESQFVAKNMKGNDEFKVDEEVPLFLYTCNGYKPSLMLECSSSFPVLPVRDSLSVQPKSQSFQLQDKSKSRRCMLFMKSRPNNEILSVGGSRRL